MSSTFPFPDGDRPWSTASMDMEEPPAGESGDDGGSGENGSRNGKSKSSNGNGTSNGSGKSKGSGNPVTGRATNGSGQGNGSGPANGQKPRRGRRNARKPDNAKSAVRPTKAAPARSNGTAPQELQPAEGQAPDRQLSRVGELEDRVERLSVICEAMWDLLSTEIGLDLGRLAARVDEMDPDAGHRNVPHGSDVSSCPTCGKPMPAGARSCLFCAARSAEDEAENWPKIDD